MVDPAGKRPAARPIAAIPEPIWGPLAVGSALGAVGAIGLAAGQPWLFPSLGPTAFLMAEKPGDPSSRPYNAIVGHLVGLAAGLAAVYLTGARHAPAAGATGELAAARVLAAVVAAALTMAGLSLLKAPHAPAAATMLLIALGGLPPTGRAAATVGAGVLILVAVGEGLKALRRGPFPPPDR